MKTVIIKVNIRAEPERYQALICALNYGTEYEGMLVSMYQEILEHLQPVGVFTMREPEPDPENI